MDQLFERRDEGPLYMIASYDEFCNLLKKGDRLKKSRLGFLIPMTPLFATVFVGITPRSIEEFERKVKELPYTIKAVQADYGCIDTVVVCDNSFDMFVEQYKRFEDGIKGDSIPTNSQLLVMVNDDLQTRAGAFSRMKHEFFSRRN